MPVYTSDRISIEEIQRAVKKTQKDFILGITGIPNRVIKLVVDEAP